MFDTSEAVDSRATAGLVATSHRMLLDHETRLLELAAHWADLHAVVDPERPGGERLRLYGGSGTPEVGEFAAAELGVLQDTTTFAAAAQMADALDLRHRLPRLWALVCGGGVRVWKAGFVAKATRYLSEAAAGLVDDAVAGHISTLPWGRFETLLTGRIMEADPEGALRRQEIYDAERFVRTGRSNAYGLKLLVARANAGDVIWFVAMVNRIADLLEADGDTDDVDVRRSKAIGIIAQPAVALSLLQRRHASEDAETAAAEHAHEDANSHKDEDAHAAGDNGNAASDRGGAGDDDAERGSTDQHDSAIVLPGVRIDPVSLRAAAPPVTLNLHVSEEAVVRGNGGIARMETVGPVLLTKLREMLAGTHITIRPVIDPEITPVDAYEVPHRIREQVILTHPYEIFPFGGAASRRADLDHTQPYRPIDDGGPPGQTRPDNLGPLSRRPHRIKTHSGWQVRQPSPGVFLWRTTHGYISLVTNRGTLTLGNGAYANTLWQTAAPA